MGSFDTYNQHNAGLLDIENQNHNRIQEEEETGIYNPEEKYDRCLVRLFEFSNDLR